MFDLELSIPGSLEFDRQKEKRNIKCEDLSKAGGQDRGEGMRQSLGKFLWRDRRDFNRVLRAWEVCANVLFW